MARGSLSIRVILKTVQENSATQQPRETAVELLFPKGEVIGPELVHRQHHHQRGTLRGLGHYGTWRRARRCDQEREQCDARKSHSSHGRKMYPEEPGYSTTLARFMPFFGRDLTVPCLASLTRNVRLSANARHWGRLAGVHGTRPEDQLDFGAPFV